MHGNIISNKSLEPMEDWFDIDDDQKKGYGLEYFTNEYGVI